VALCQTPFSKRKENKNTVLIATIVGFYTVLIATIVGFYARLTIMAMQVSFKQALAQSFARYCCSSKIKLKLFRKQRKPN